MKEQQLRQVERVGWMWLWSLMLVVLTQTIGSNSSLVRPLIRGTPLIGTHVFIQGSAVIT